MQSKAKTVAKYLAELPEERRAVMAAVRKVILANLDKDFEEGMQYGMIGYYVPHRLYPPGYHCDPKQPLPFFGLASQKQYMSLYIACGYGSSDDRRWFQQAWAKTGKKLNMGQCCVRFKKLEDLALDVIAQAVGRMSVPEYIRQYESTLKPTSQRRTKAKAKAGKPARRARSTSPRRKRSPASK